MLEEEDSHAVDADLALLVKVCRGVEFLMGEYARVVRLGDSEKASSIRKELNQLAPHRSLH
jgi:hypothetical protein